METMRDIRLQWESIRLPEETVAILLIERMAYNRLLKETISAYMDLGTNGLCF